MVANPSDRGASHQSAAREVEVAAAAAGVMMAFVADVDAAGEDAVGASAADDAEVPAGDAAGVGAVEVMPASAVGRTAAVVVQTVVAAVLVVALGEWGVPVVVCGVVGAWSKKWRWWNVSHLSEPPKQV